MTELRSPSPTPAGALPVPGVTQARVLAAEWIKLRGLRSTTVAVLLTVVAVVGTGAAMAVGQLLGEAPDDGAPGTADPLGGSLSGVGVAVIAVATLGVLSVTGEYATRLIRPTLTAVPTRLPVLWAKAGVVGAVVLVTGVVSSVAAFLVAQAVLSGGDHALSLSEPGVARAVIGAGLYLAVAAVLAVGLAWVVRNTAGSVAAVLGLLWIPSLVGPLLPAGVRDRVVPWLPDNAGTAVMQVPPGEGALPPWLGLGVFALYALAALGGAALLLRRRDA